MVVVMLMMSSHRTLSCIQELPVQGRITSLDISSDHRKLLSCCRDNSLQLVDLRRWSKECMFFRYKQK